MGWTFSTLFLMVPQQPWVILETFLEFHDYAGLQGAPRQKNSHVGALTPRTSEGGCVWRRVFKEGIKVT